MQLPRKSLVYKCLRSGTSFDGRVGMVVETGGGGSGTHGSGSSLPSDAAMR